MYGSDGRLNTAVEKSKGMLAEFDLCDSCLGRMHAGGLEKSSSLRLGAMIRRRLKAKAGRCYICKGLLDNLAVYVEQMEAIARDIDHDTFVVGTRLRPSVVDRDDLIRSRFQTRGAVGIKSEVTRCMTRMLKRRTKKRVDHQNPDLTLLAEMRTETCLQYTRPMLVRGRYTKVRRGLAQKQKPCEDCRGAGCIFCNNHGIVKFESVEGIISRFLYDTFECRQARFTWTGGEDKDSLVGGHGRPFIAKILGPKKRRARLRRVTDLGPVQLCCMRRINIMPAMPAPFKSRIAIQVRVENGMTAASLKSLDRLAGSRITVSDGTRTAYKMIYDIKAERQTAKLLAIHIEADGGTPVKGLVDGSMTNPSIAGMLGCRCTCVRFDITDIDASS